jgi:hypothetical protein
VYKKLTKPDLKGRVVSHFANAGEFNSERCSRHFLSLNVISLNGNLIRKGRAHKPRIGSSAGKIGKTRVIGAKKVLKDFRRLTKTLQDLMRKYGKGDTKALQKSL